VFGLLRYLKAREWLQVLLVLLFAVLQVRFDLLVPDHMRRITVLVQTPGSPLSDILVAGGFMLLFALLSLACVIVVSFFASRVSSGLSLRLRDLIFSKVGSFSMEEFSRFSTSSLIARSTNDITQVQQFTMSAMQMLLKVPILAVGGFVGIAGGGAEWAVAAVIAFVFVLIVVSCAMIVVIPQFRKMQGLVDKIGHTARESLAGRYVVRAFNAEEFHEERFEEANLGFTHADKTTNRAMAVMGPVMSLGTNGVILAAYIIGAFLISSAGEAEALGVFSNMVVMTFYLGLLFTAVKFIIKVLPRVPRAFSSARRIFEVLETVAEPGLGLREQAPAQRGTRVGGGQDAGDGVPSGDSCDTVISFDNVSFRYPGASADALEGVSFAVNRGESVAIIGSTGCGKSTLVNLVMRFFPATTGEVLIKGVNVKEYEREALYDLFGFVPQRSVLFRGTIRSNIAYGDNGRGAYRASDIENAARIARVDQFTDSLADGLDAAVSQRGSNYSGGQKQRVAIARAVCRDPEIFVFDDSFSALDGLTDQEVRKALTHERAGVTRLIVAQRISSIMDADRIIVMDEGRLVGVGSHPELMGSCEIYKEIAASQELL